LSATLSAFTSCSVLLANLPIEESRHRAGPSASRARKAPRLSRTRITRTTARTTADNSFCCSPCCPCRFRVVRVPPSP